MYHYRTGSFAIIPIAIAIIVSLSLICSPIVSVAQEASTGDTTTQEQTTTETTTDTQESTTETEESATDVEPTGETFSELTVASTDATEGEGEEGQGNGEDGEDAEVPGQVLAATSTDGTGGQSDIGGTIITGDATATTTVTNEMNSNTANPDAPGETNSSSITNENANEGELGSLATSTADTGSNEAEGGQGLSTIVTGNALSTASVINVINTNIFNSEGLILFLNQLFGSGFDLRNFDLSYFFDDPADTVSSLNPDCDTPSGCEEDCTLLSCLNSSSMNVINTNTATVTNSVIVRATTGQNTASSTGEGGADIDTGDAYAAANVLNLVNTNVINSKYLVVSFNNFGNLVQDITLPSAEFFRVLLGQGSRMPEMNSSTFDVQNTNDVDFTGTTTAAAVTGDNMALTGTTTETDMDVATTSATSTPGSGSIETGNAYSMTNTYTQANSTQIGGTSMLLLFRVWGGWSGDVVGLPEGLTWMHTPDGIAVMTDNASETMAHTMGEFNSSAFLASSTNNAVIDNNVDVLASTGENLAMTEHGAATISTGDAYAVANVTNLINTNVVNGNWIFGVFNVFGDWSGNISFGHPDLVLEAKAKTPEPTVPGSEIEYTFTVKNTGDMNADNVTLTTAFNGAHLDVLEGAIETATGASLNLGAIPMGVTKEFKIKGKVSNPTNSTFTIPLEATVSSESTDNDTHDNAQIVTVVVNGPQIPNNPGGSTGGGGGGGGGGGIAGSFMRPITPTWTADPMISVVKTSSFTSATIPSTVDYKVVVTNSKSAGPSYNTVLTDILYDPDGEVVYERSWNLDAVPGGDEITLTYSVEFASTTKPGVYKNVARVTGIKNFSTVGTGGVMMNPVEASSEVEFSAAGQVLGVTSTPSESDTSSTACSAYLNSFLARGLRNNTSEVRKLQQFLNTSMSAGLPVTGSYGPMTAAQVKAFQMKSGIKPASGSVYSLTQAAINSEICGGPVAVAKKPTIKGTTAKAVKPKATVKTAKKPTPKPAAKKTPPAAITPTTPTTQATPPKTSGVSKWLKSFVPFVSGKTN